MARTIFSFPEDEAVRAFTVLKAVEGKLEGVFSSPGCDLEDCLWGSGGHGIGLVFTGHR